MSPFRRQAGGVLAAEIDGYRLLIQAPAYAGDLWAYTVLRRQYGQGSPFALVGAGKEPTRSDAVHAAERLACLVVPGDEKAAADVQA